MKIKKIKARGMTACIILVYIIFMMSSCRSKQVLSEQSSSAELKSVDSTSTQRTENATSTTAEETETEVTWYDTSAKKDSVTGLYPVVKKAITKQKKKVNTSVQAQSVAIAKSTKNIENKTSSKSETIVKNSLSILGKLAQWLAGILVLIGIGFYLAKRFKLM